MTVGPSNDDVFDGVGGGQAKMQAHTRLSEVAVSSTDALTIEVLLGFDCDAGADGISIAGASLQADREPGGACGFGEVILEEPQPGSTSVGEPEIEVTIAVPVDPGEGTAVIDEIESTGGRDIGEAA